MYIFYYSESKKIKTVSKVRTAATARITPQPTLGKIKSRQPFNLQRYKESDIKSKNNSPLRPRLKNKHKNLTLPTLFYPDFFVIPSKERKFALFTTFGQTHRHGVLPTPPSPPMTTPHRKKHKKTIQKFKYSKNRWKTNNY